MANYYATTRSNYFKVKDPATFEDWCRKRNLDFWTHEHDGQTLYAISADTLDSNGWPSQVLEVDKDGTEDAVELDVAEEIAEHLHPSSAAVLVEVGNEKLRYLVGYATAVHPDGRTHTISLHNICTEAQAIFGDDTIEITEARY